MNNFSPDKSRDDDTGGEEERRGAGERYEVLFADIRDVDGAEVVESEVFDIVLCDVYVVLELVVAHFWMFWVAGKADEDEV